MVIVTKKLIFSVGEVWLDEEPGKLDDVDALCYMQRTHPIEGVQSDEFHTRLIDLTKSHNELYESIGKNDRYEIRRAEQKDDVVYEFWEQPDSDILNNFSDLYDLFALEKSLPKINRTQLKRRAEAGVIDISCVKLKDGTPLVWHVYYRSKSRVRFLYSASVKKSNNTQLLGRANRYHHWQDIVRFKNSEIEIYDWGGWYIGNTDQEKLGINKFKEKFGGEIVKTFNCYRGITIKGKLYFKLLKIFKGLPFFFKATLQRRLPGL